MNGHCQIFRVDKDYCLDILVESERKKGIQNGSRFLAQVTSFIKTSKTLGAAVVDRNEFKFKYIELEVPMKQLHDGDMSKEGE